MREHRGARLGLGLDFRDRDDRHARLFLDLLGELREFERIFAGQEHLVHGAAREDLNFTASLGLEHKILNFAKGRPLASLYFPSLKSPPINSFISSLSDPNEQT